MPTLNLTPAEIGERGSAIYQERLKSLLELSHHGQFVAIDINTGDYDLGTEAHEASDQLRARHPEAQILVERIGYPAVFHVRRVGTFQ
ncbi:MAG: hypothetical protein DWH91_17730 [Planctomycetota bacterium]|nr:MAG: hypothetical protein DWH91_17730 [Planctomycetota bacterium]